MRKIAVALAAGCALFGAAVLWPGPVRIGVPGVDGRVHEVGGKEAIFHCILEQDDEGLRRLLAEAHDLDRPLFEADGWTFLHHAAYQGSPVAVALLIDRGADVNARVNGGPTPLQIAIRRGRTEVAKILRAHGAR